MRSKHGFDQKVGRSERSGPESDEGSEAFNGRIGVWIAVDFRLEIAEPIIERFFPHLMSKGLLLCPIVSR